MSNRLEIAKKFANIINSNEIKQIILFGSVARGEDNNDSDIDILIITDSKDEIKDFVYDKVTDFSLYEEEYISAHFISQNHFNKTKNFSFLTNVLDEGVILG